ncbi:MAG: hypothetical protein GQ542_12770 [Desulforhopalus sp.]|nr:hypothetical protein [Desulforhopalus sp.]
MHQIIQVAMELAPQSNLHLVHTYGFTQVYLGDHMVKYAEDAIADLADNKLERFVEQNNRALPYQYHLNK